MAFRELSQIFKAYKGTGWNCISSLDFARGILFLLDFYKARPKPLTGKMITNPTHLKNVIKSMEYSVPTYGAALLNYCGYGNGLYDFLKSNPHLKSTISHLNLTENDILLWKFNQAEMYHSNFFVAYERERNVIVVSIRGTFNVAEALVDTQLEYYPFLDGYGHKGMIKASETFETMYHDMIMNWITERGATSLHFVGHSLGSAIASLYLIKTRKIFLERFGPDFSVTATNFACPPCISRDIVTGTSCDFLESYVNCNDLVPHLVLFRLIFRLMQV
jgi:hypothetical protein